MASGWSSCAVIGGGVCCGFGGRREGALPAGAGAGAGRGLDHRDPTGLGESESSRLPCPPAQSRFLTHAPPFTSSCPSFPFSSLLSKFLKEKQLKKHTHKKGTER